MRRNRPPERAFLKPLLVLILFAIADLIPAPVPAAGSWAYIDDLTITVRRGPGIDYKIISFLSPGEPVEVLANQEGWSQVRFEEDRTGWVLERYLMKEPSLKSRSKTLVSQNQRLKESVSVLERSNSSLRAYLNQPAEVFRNIDPERSHSPRELSQALALAKRLLKEETARVRLLQERREAEEDLRKWFLIGSGIAAMGMVLGVLTHRSRRWFRFRA